MTGMTVTYLRVFHLLLSDDSKKYIVFQSHPLPKRSSLKILRGDNLVFQLSRCGINELA